VAFIRSLSRPVGPMRHRSPQGPAAQGSDIGAFGQANA